MTVGEFRELSKDVADDVTLLIPLYAGNGFDGMFYTPCTEESGMADVDAHYMDDDETMGEEQFLLLPCGFFEINEQKDMVEMN
jgi:hypothetical protein